MFLETFLDLLTTRGHTWTWQCCCGVGVVPGYVYKHIEKLDTDKRAYGWLPLMASSSGGQIGALCAETYCERILSDANDVCHEGNTLLDTEEINMLVVLCMN